MCFKAINFHNFGCKLITCQKAAQNTQIKPSETLQIWVFVMQREILSQTG